MRRSKQKIKEDFRIIVEAAKTSTTIEELSKKTGLSKFQISNTLAKVKLQEILGGEKEEHEQQDEVFLLDASAMASLDLKKYLNDPKVKIVLTSTTIEELSKIKHRQDYDGYMTRKILKMATSSKSEKFILEQTPKYFKDPVLQDNFLIEHCKKKNYTVLTCDSDMILRAKNEGVKFVRLGHHKRKLLSLGALNCPKGKANFVAVHSNKWLAVLERDGKVIKNADGKPVQLHDIVYRANKIRENHVQIKKFEVVALSAKSNCVHLDTFDFHKAQDIDPTLPYADIVLQAFLCLQCKKKV